MTVWVEGATGKAGRRVVEALAVAGVAVRAASRHPGEPSPGVTPVLFDWYDPATWTSALGDANAMLVKGLDSDDNAPEIISQLIDSAPEVRHVVLMSGVGVDRAPDEAPRRALELAVQSSGREWTILRPNWFLQNFNEDEWVFAKALREQDELWAASADSRISFCDTRDIADAAVVVLTQEGHHGRGYTLTGPERATFSHVAEVLGQTSGRPIRHVDPPPAQHWEYFARSGRPEAWIDHMMHLFELVRANVFAPVTDDFQRLTGNLPRSLEAYAKEFWSC